ncbi:hypothetical protein GGI20_003607 [Coemansia sp. BCRC 34301]|nr:hypothetical protein GGI20_003607 [Coemansia sp. BCRC 34301]
MDNVQSLLGFVAAWVAINAAVKLIRIVSKDAEWRWVSVELVSPLHLRVTTTALNDTVMALAHGLTARVPLAGKAVDAFYSTGVLVAITSMLLCLALLATAGVQIATAIVAHLGFGSAWSLLQWPFVSDSWRESVFGSTANSTVSIALPENSGSLHRRLVADTTASQATSQWLRPVIPGITMPLGHLWYYLLSLVLCAIVHELGHALAAARARIRLRSFGLFVMGVYPGAFVDLPRDKLEQAPVVQQLRIVCAGVWHNAVAALLAWLLVHSGGLGWAFSHSGWVRADAGVVVVDVSQSSPLYGHIPLLSTVYRVDDIELHTPVNNASYMPDQFGSSPIARWSNVLTNTRDSRETATAGFCARLADNVDDGLCCEMSPQFPLGESPDANIFCFERYKRPVLQAPSSSMCFDLRNALARSGSIRCQSDQDCAIGASGGRQTLFGRKGHDMSQSSSSSSSPGVCVLPSSPYPESRVIRLYHHPFGEKRQGEMLIYVGSPKALWLEMQVSSLQPRWRWLSCRLPSWTEALFQYVLSFSLAFCLLNAIPAWYLDGDHLLRLLLSVAQARWGSAPRLTLPQHLVDGEEGSSSDSEPDLDAAETLPEASHATADGKVTELVELVGMWQRTYIVSTALTTALLAWCIVGSVVLLAL